jgi:uncharacterized membrane-anchored protein YitT (DUF2179 family)
MNRKEKERRKYVKKHMANNMMIQEIHPYTTSIEKEELNSIEISIEYNEVNKMKEECNEIEKSAKVVFENIPHNNCFIYFL